MTGNIVGFVLNAAWQVPLLAVGAAILLRAAPLAPEWRCRGWSACLFLALLLPLNIQRAVIFHENQPGMSQSPAPARRLLVVRIPAHQVSPRIQQEPPRARGGFTISPGTAELLFLLYLAATGLGGGRLFIRFARAERLKRESDAIELPPELVRAIHCFMSSHDMKAPAVRMNAFVSSPAVVGLATPTIVVPADFADYEEGQARAALLHECAHIVRRDYRSNLICELIALPLIWHPIVHVILGRISDSREMACDGLAVRQMEDPACYARSLVALASRILDKGPRLALALPLLGRATLTARVAALIQTDIGAQGMATRATAFAILVPAILAPAMMLHLTPSIAVERPVLARHVANGPSNRTAADAVAAFLAASDSTGPVNEQQFIAAPLSNASADIAAQAATGAVSAGSESTEAPSATPASQSQPFSAEARSALESNGIGQQELTAFARAGYSSLSTDDLLSLHYNGVTSEFVSRLSSAGFPPFTPDELLALEFNGVSAREIAGLGRIGGSRLGTADIVRLHYGVSTAFIERLASLGYANLSADQILQSYYSGTNPKP